MPGDEDNLGRFVVGKVLDCDRHPDADKLSVCTVDVGEDTAADHRLRGAERRDGADRGRGSAWRRDAGRHSHHATPNCGASPPRA